VVLVKGGVDADHFHPPETPPTRDRVLFVGRLLPHKGIDQLIAALPTDLPLTVCGRAYHADYFAVLRRLAEGKRVEFRTDATDDETRDLYRRAWATVLPSVYRDYYGHSHVQPELMGFTLLESMACGTPAICSRVGGMPEFVRHGRTGFVFDELSELTGYLRALASDPMLTDRMGKEARRVVEREFDRRVCGSKLVALYRELIVGCRTAGRRAA
jgi:glycosyltransferase involved in cell wall biosynthesis